MKHTFYVFPAGLTGIALLLLRGAVVLSLASVLLARASPAPWQWTVIGAAAIAVSLGYRTRTAAGAAAGIILLKMCVLISAMPLQIVSQSLAAVVLTMVGPGALSIDAKLFGRKTVRLFQ